MDVDQKVFNQIATTLARHFESMYYVEIESGKYIEFVEPKLLGNLDVPKRGDDFWNLVPAFADKCVHPDDYEYVLKVRSKDIILKNLSDRFSNSFGCRLLVDGKIIHIRHIDIMCDDGKHILCCMENTEAEYREKEEQKRNLQSAERRAKRDELTGIKNKNAFMEYKESIESKLKTEEEDHKFAVVMCDVNDLKLINDTRGHNFGDEAIQRTSRMICNIFKHSPVFRIGGDEFVAVLLGSDYELRDQLLQMLRDESETNGRSRSGPVVASGMAVYEPDSDQGFSTVFERADKLMYDNKKMLKAQNKSKTTVGITVKDKPIPLERKQLLDRMFGAMLTVAGEGYLYLNDMQYDYSRWSLSLVDDFGIQSEYMYHADTVLENCVHPDDLALYRDAVDAVFSGNAEVKHICYRARKEDGNYVLLSTRGFVLNDSEGDPEYFGGIILKQ